MPRVLHIPFLWRFSVLVRLDTLPLPHADGPEAAPAPEKIVVLGLLALAQEVRKAVADLVGFFCGPALLLKRVSSNKFTEGTRRTCAFYKV